MYSFALDVLLEFKPDSGPSKFYAYYADEAIAPDSNWVNLYDPTFVITDLSSGNYTVNVVVWDLAFEIIATGSFNFSLSSSSNGGPGPDIGGITSAVSMLLAIGILVLIRTQMNSTRPRK